MKTKLLLLFIFASLAGCGPMEESVGLGHGVSVLFEFSDFGYLGADGIYLFPIAVTEISRCDKGLYLVEGFLFEDYEATEPPLAHRVRLTRIPIALQVNAAAAVITEVDPGASRGDCKVIRGATKISPDSLISELRKRPSARFQREVFKGLDGWTYHLSPETDRFLRQPESEPTTQEAP